MPTLQSSGQISIGDISDIVNGDDEYANASLKTYSDLAATLASGQRKEMTVGAPYALSEFYGLIL